MIVACGVESIKTIQQLRGTFQTLRNSCFWKDFEQVLFFVRTPEFSIVYECNNGAMGTRVWDKNEHVSMQKIRYRKLVSVHLFCASSDLDTRESFIYEGSSGIAFRLNVDNRPFLYLYVASVCDRLKSSFPQLFISGVLDTWSTKIPATTFTCEWIESAYLFE